MKKTNTGETRVNLKNNTHVDINFNRFGEKGKPRTKELFWLSRAGAFTLEDLQKIAQEAEELLKVVNE